MVYYIGAVRPILRVGRNSCQVTPRASPGLGWAFRAVIQHSLALQQNGRPIYPDSTNSVRYESLVFELLSGGNDTIRHTCGFSI
jgi:hypothetical protein